MKDFSKYFKYNIFPLTPRELEVLKPLTQGLTNKQIAKELGVTAYTTKAHVSSILRKLHVQDRLQAAMIAVKTGLV